ncbi:hypothetical protein D3C79_1000320 [compost metagenome]
MHGPPGQVDRGLHRARRGQQVQRRHVGTQQQTYHLALGVEHRRLRHAVLGQDLPGIVDAHLGRDGERAPGHHIAHRFQRLAFPRRAFFRGRIGVERVLRGQRRGRGGQGRGLG